jgi:histidinol-phosphatase
MAALDIIVREAGGRFSNLDGIDGSLGGNGLSTNGALHDYVVAALRPNT